MRDITEDEIRSSFSERTFSRGLNYFENGYVRMGVKKGDNLIGTVLGSMPHPYKVEAEITDEIYCRCTCPVGAMCKHGVALLLQWINNKDSFVDADSLLASLRKKSKEELIKIISSILEYDPALASRLAFSEEVKKKKINIEAISRRLRHVGREFIDYYAVPGVVEELESVKEIGNSLAKEGQLTDAVEVYLLLIKWGIDAYESGVDDSSGTLGDVMIECVEDFNEIAEHLGKEQKRGLIHRIIDIIELENYGLETDEMLFGVATKENMSLIEEELLKRIPTSGEDFHVKYGRRRILNLLSDLYEALGMQEDTLRVMKEAGLVNEDDYVRMAKALITQGDHEKAYTCVKEGLLIEEELDNRLGELYFTLLHRFLSEEKEVEVHVEEMMTIALDVLSRFNPRRYAIITDVFKKIGEHEKLVVTIKKRCEEDVVIAVLLYENRIDEAIEHALSSPTSYSALLIEVANVAKEEEKIEAARKLTLKALKQGFTSIYEPVNELITLTVAESDESELKEAITYIRHVSIAKVFADALLEKNQEYTVMVLRRFISDIKREEVMRYVMHLDTSHAKKLCHYWVSEFVNRSHVYYDDAIDILKIMKKMITEREWKEYVSAFMEDHRGKKKLLEKIEKARIQ